MFVVLIKATVNQLEQALELIDCLEELRRAKETPNIIINSSLQDQKQWTEDLLQRVKIDDTSSIAVIILDTGINYYHPLHALVCNENQADCWHPDWPHFDRSDSSNLSKPEDHGSRQAGLAVFGDLCDVMSSSEPILIKHSIESGRILPPSGQNQDPELYGHITVDTAAKLEIKHPNRNRVYSLAVTADSAYMGGQPSSWSAEIDQFSSGIQDKKQRLFIISTGNNRDLSPNVSLWNQLHLAEIEDPAPSWNALTIGAYTEKTTNDNPAFNGWAPFARVGDVAPASRSSVNWEWRKHAPYKPDLVAEGGNRLLSPDGKELSTEDVVSLLTTSGRTTGQLFEVSRDTSAACALVSRQAAIIMTEYPKYWPETVRGLLVHSAKWTRAMRQQFKLLSDKPTNMAKENMLRSVGYGVPNLERALYSANNVLTLIAQNHLKPFKSGKSDAIMNEMQLYKLPWPSEVLHQLPPNTEVKLRVTLSYFIEPNPGCRGYRDRFRYQSHGLRFAVIRPDQKLENFLASINKLAVTEEYKSLEGTATGWFLGPKLRTRGCLHADMWSGSAAALANMHTIAIFPVGGWWKYHSAKERWKNSVRYSLIVSIEAPDETIDIYSVVENMIETKINIEV